MNFIYKPNSETINDEIFQQIHPPPPLFLTHFPNFWDNLFRRKIQLSCTTIHRPLTPCWVSEKTNQAIPRKLPNGRTEGQKDGQNPIHRTLPATARDPISDIPPFLKQPLTPFTKKLTLPFFSSKISTMQSTPVRDVTTTLIYTLRSVWIEDSLQHIHFQWVYIKIEFSSSSAKRSCQVLFSRGEKTKPTGLVRGGWLCKFLSGILLQKDSLNIKGCWVFFQNTLTDFFSLAEETFTKVCENAITKIIPEIYWINYFHARWCRK